MQPLFRFPARRGIPVPSPRYSGERARGQERWLLWLAAIFFTTNLAHATERDIVAAKVGSDTISIGEVNHEMRIALGERKLADDEREVLQAQTLGLLANRQLVIQYLRKM